MGRNGGVRPDDGEAASASGDKGIRPRIPGRTSRATVRYDKRRYRRRKGIEIMFGRLKDCCKFRCHTLQICCHATLGLMALANALPCTPYGSPLHRGNPIKLIMSWG